MEQDNRLIVSSKLEKYVLQQLETNSGKWISGGKLASQANVSRNTIWRIINKLQDAGYSINSVTGRGYQLKVDLDKLSKYGIELNMNNPDKYQIKVFDTVESTNTLLKEQARKGGNPGSLFVANSQSSGRGRRGRDFFSPPGSGVYFSLLIRPDQYFNPGQKSPALAAVALAAAVDKISEKNTQIKWVNDVYLNNKKISGILSEAELDFETGSIAYLVIGVGVNVYQPLKRFPEDIENSATAIFSTKDRKSGFRNKLVAEFINQWEFYADPNNSGKALSAYKKKSILTGKTVDIWHNHKMFKAKVLDMNQEYELIIELEDGAIKTINHGEATLHQNH